jgi:hypothetical protein
MSTSPAFNHPFGHDPDPIVEAHAALDQLSRVAISSVLQLAELTARRGAGQAMRQRGEEVAFAGGMVAQLEGGPAQGLGQDARLADATGGVGGQPWRGALDENWWSSATAGDLGEAWSAATAQAAAGNPEAAEALEELRSQVQLRWGLSVDDVGAAVDQRQPEGATAPQGQGAVAAPVLGTDNVASQHGPVAVAAVPGTIEELLSVAHPLSAQADLAAFSARSGDDIGAAARRLPMAQPVELGGQVGLG